MFLWFNCSKLHGRSMKGLTFHYNCLWNAFTFLNCQMFWTELYTDVAYPTTFMGRDREAMEFLFPGGEVMEFWRRKNDRNHVKVSKCCIRWLLLFKCMFNAYFHPVFFNELFYGFFHHIVEEMKCRNYSALNSVPVRVWLSRGI